MFQSVRAFALFRAARGTVVLLRAVDAVKDVLRRHKFGYTMLITSVVVVGAGFVIATLDQSDPERNIRSIPDGLWWAVTTITTVGYGDRFPYHAGRTGGRSRDLILGIGLLGLLTASLASLREGPGEGDRPADRRDE